MDLNKLKQKHNIAEDDEVEYAEEVKPTDITASVYTQHIRPEPGDEIIELTQGKQAIVSACDYEMLVRHNWYAQKQYRSDNWYACTHVYIDGRRTVVSMQRMLLGITDSNLMADHMDGNTLNNRRSNLRVATRSQNGANRVPIRGKRYLGISRKVVRGHVYWIASLQVNGVYYASNHREEWEAAIGYNKLAIKHHGEFARLNMVKPSGRLCLINDD